MQVAVKLSAKADLREQIKTISVPVLIIAGQQDPVTTVADGQVHAS